MCSLLKNEKLDRIQINNFKVGIMNSLEDVKNSVNKLLINHNKELIDIIKKVYEINRTSRLPKPLKETLELDVAFPHDYETVNNSTYLDKLDSSLEVIKNVMNNYEEHIRHYSC